LIEGAIRMERRRLAAVDALTGAGKSRGADGGESPPLRECALRRSRV
jgi:hypothetical protein